MSPSLPIFLKILQTRSKGGVLGTEVKKCKKRSIHGRVFTNGIEPARKLRFTAESCACSADENVYSHKRERKSVSLFTRPNH